MFFQTYLSRTLCTITTGLLIFFSLASAAETVVCSATLSSDNELNAFKKSLGSSAKFVELIDFAKSQNTDESWFDDACQSGVKCDVLIISGHFTDHFFGNGMNLSLKNIEKHACAKTCKNILENPKEVHLLGCNTLSSKGTNALRANLPGYAQILRQSGYNDESIRQYFHELFSPIGITLSQRYQLAFSEVPRIYGYTSIGPKGSQIEAEFNRYTESSKSYYEKIGQQQKAGLVSNNSAYLKIVGGRSPLTQVRGDFFQEDRISSDVCRIQDNKVDWQDRINSLVSVMSHKPLERLTFIQYFLRTLLVEMEPAKAQEIFGKAMVRLPQVKELYLNSFKKNESLLDSLVLGEILVFAGAITNSEYESKTSLLFQKLNRDSHEHEAATSVCVAAKQSFAPERNLLHFINSNDIDESGIDILKCIPTKRSDMHQGLLKMLRATDDVNLKRRLVDVLSVQILKQSNIENDLLDLFVVEKDTQARRYLIKTLGKIENLSNNTIRILKEHSKNPETELILRFEIKRQLNEG